MRRDFAVSGKSVRSRTGWPGWMASSLFGVGASRATGWHWVESDDRVAGRSRRVLESLAKGRCRPAGGATSPQSPRSWFFFHRKVLALALPAVQRYDGGRAVGGAPMNENELFQAALGLLPPWLVSRCTFSESAGRLDIHLDFPRGGVFPCPVCGVFCKAYDTDELTWRHLNFFQHQAFLHARTPRVQCSRCGVHRVAVPWARPDSGFTLLFEALVMMLAKSTPVLAVARLVDEHDTLVWRIVTHYVDAARAKADHSTVTQVGVDETSSRRGQNYVSLFVDLEQRKVLFATRARMPPPSRFSPKTSRRTVATPIPSPKSAPTCRKPSPRESSQTYPTPRLPSTNSMSSAWSTTPSRRSAVSNAKTIPNSLAAVTSGSRTPSTSPPASGKSSTL